MANWHGRKDISEISSTLGTAPTTHDIKNTVGNHLGIDADLGRTLGQSENDGVADPEEDSHAGGHVEDSFNVGCLKRRSLSSVHNNAVEDDQEELEGLLSHVSSARVKERTTYCIADGVHEPSGPFRTLLQGGEETHENHDEVGKDDGNGLDLGDSGQQAEV